MKKILLVSIIVLFAGALFAVTSGKQIAWKGGGKGKVVFDGKNHADQGLKCAACHPTIFKMKKGTAKMKMKDMNKGKFCGACHDGKKAFATNDKKKLYEVSYS